MKTRNLLTLFSGPSGTPGEHGFRLTGVAKEGDGLCRVMLRYYEPWHRYTNPRVQSDAWDVRIYEKGDTSFALQTELTIEDLDQLAEDYAFPDGADAISKLAYNNDPVHDRAVDWARRVTGAPELSDPGDATPTRLQVRYKKSEAAKRVPSSVPAGRPTPPWHEVKSLRPTDLRSESELGAETPSKPEARGTAPTPRVAQPAARGTTPKVPPKAPPGPPAAKAPKAAARGGRPTPRVLPKVGGGTKRTDTDKTAPTATLRDNKKTASNPAVSPRPRLSSTSERAGLTERLNALKNTGDAKKHDSSSKDDSSKEG